MSTNKKTLIDGDFQVGSSHFYVDVENNRVGLNQANPTSSLDVNGNAYIATDITVASNVTVGSNVIAQTYTGNASGLTSVPANQISGVIPVENGGTGVTTTTGTGSLVKSDNPTFTGTVTADTFSGSGASLTNIPMGQATGTLAVANGGTGVTTSTGTGNVVFSASPTLTGTITAETADFSSNISASNIYAGHDTDMTSYLGRAAVGFSGVSDEATFAHVDVNSTNNYALKQTATGETEVNSATSKSVIFSINDSEQGRINTTGLGIGTNNPQYKLDVHGTANVGALTCLTVSGDGYLLSNITGYSWPTHINGNDIYYTTGNVGIGTATPGNTLEVAGTASVPILKSAADAATSTYNSLLNGPRPGTTSEGAIHFINGSTRTTDGGASTYTIRNNSGNLRLGHENYNTLLEGDVGIGVTDPDSKLEVRGNIRASFSDTNHGMFIDAGGTILRNYDGANGAGFYFTANAIWPTDYLGSYSAGGIDLGSSTYRWNNVYTEALNASGTVTASSFSGIQVSDVPTLNQDTTGQAGTIAGQANSATITASDTAGNSTIVQRSSSGHIFANFFNTTPDDVSTGVTKVCVETGNDGYIRHGTSAAISSFLGLTNSATIAASDTAGNSTIVQRSSSGHIFANFFNTTPDDVSTGVTKVCVETGNDGYIRHGTSAAISSFLGLANSATIAASADAGNSTIVQRSGDGYIFSNYVNTTDSAVTADVTAIMCKKGDDYHRSANAGAVNTFLGSFTNFFRRNSSNDVNVRIAAAHGRGVRFWDSDSYKIYMSSATDGTWGGRKDSSDYNMYFRMTSGTTRGFVFLNNRTVRCHINGNGDLYLDGGWLRTYSSRGWYSQTYGGGWHMQDTTYMRCYNGKTVYTSGAFLAGGNVTAYSDIRRKKDLLKIDNALDKVEQLTGYTYTNKKDNKRYTGLIAQDVEKVLPEAVTTETDGHLSLAYGNMMGLLVEAVKELTRKNEILEARLNAIENNT